MRRGCLHQQLCCSWPPARPAAAVSRSIRYLPSRVVSSRALNDRDQVINENEREPGQQYQQQDAPQQEPLQEQHNQQQPLVWCQGMFGGTFVDEVRSCSFCIGCQQQQWLWYTAELVTLQKAVPMEHSCASLPAGHPSNVIKRNCVKCSPVNHPWLWECQGSWHRAGWYPSLAAAAAPAGACSVAASGLAAWQSPAGKHSNSSTASSSSSSSRW
jgi:hypothetical protein